jgi:hypothetical protein
MTTLLSVFPSTQDLKIKAAGKGGISDGGVVCSSQTVAAGANVVLAPPPGVNWGGITLTPAQKTAGTPGGVTAFNFDAVLAGKIEEYLVFEDGTKVLVGGAATDLTANTGVGSHSAVSPFFATGGILSHPNKLEYKLIAGAVGIPTARVLIKVSLIEYDQPSDQV